MKRKVILRGFLGKTFGEEHMLDVSSPAEAIRAMCANFKEFRKMVIEYNEPGFAVVTNVGSICEDELHHPCSEIEIIPVIAGAGGFFRIILGAALIGVSFFLPTAPLLGTLGPSLASMAFGLGFSLALGGIAQLLTSTPKTPNSPADNKQFRSFSFEGPVNVVGQGAPVPVGYGRMIIGSVVISTNLRTEQLAAGGEEAPETPPITQTVKTTTVTGTQPVTGFTKT